MVINSLIVQQKNGPHESFMACTKFPMKKHTVIQKFSIDLDKVIMKISTMILSIFFFLLSFSKYSQTLFRVLSAGVLVYTPGCRMKAYK